MLAIINLGRLLIPFLVSRTEESQELPQSKKSKIKNQNNFFDFLLLNFALLRASFFKESANAITFRI
jgi:hypothetical protein